MMNVHVERAESADEIDDRFDLTDAYTFDDVTTGELALRQLQVRMAENVPAPIPAPYMGSGLPAVGRDWNPLLWAAVGSGLIVGALLAIVGMVTLGGGA